MLIYPNSFFHKNLSLSIIVKWLVLFTAFPLGRFVKYLNENMGGEMQKSQVIEWSNSIQYPIRLKYIFLLDGTR